jgi:hypothetical protein
MITVERKYYKLMLDDKTGSVSSIMDKETGQELLSSSHEKKPVFYIRHRLKDGTIHNLSAFDATSCSYEFEESENSLKIILNFLKINREDMNAKVTIKLNDSDPLIYFFLKINNKSGISIEWVDFPNISVPFYTNSSYDYEKILWPLGEGVLIDSANIPNLSSKAVFMNNDILYETNSYPGIYPGLVTSQMLAYYNNKFGLYIASYDPEGGPKHIQPLMVENGVALNFVHYVGGNNNTKMSYPVVLRSFKGDWFTAAEFYRNWAYKQPWCRKKIFERKDIPGWWLESPVVTSFPVRCIIDSDSALINKDYYPLPKSISLLKKISKVIDSTLVPVIYQWEKSGPWVQPDCFPPIGGEKEFIDFFNDIRGFNWHGGVYSNGTRWVVESIQTGYDGIKKFIDSGAEQVSCFLPDGKPWAEIWDAPWRRSFRLCVKNKRTTDILLNIEKKLIEYGMEYLQLLDQNLGGHVFHCYSRNHGHPANPGVWLIYGMKELLSCINELCIDVNKKIIIATEGPPGEVFIPYYSGSAGRSNWLWWIGEAIPLFQFLYHEFIQIHHGDLWDFKDDNALLLKIAISFIYGDNFAIMLREKGKISLGHDTSWSRKILNQDKIIKLLKNANKLRKGAAKKYLIFGKMCRPFEIEKVDSIKFSLTGMPVFGNFIMDFEGISHNIPEILTSAWNSDGKTFGQVLINYTEQKKNIKLRIFGNKKNFKKVKIRIFINDNILKEEKIVVLPYNLYLDIDALSAALVEIT